MYDNNCNFKYVTFNCYGCINNCDNDYCMLLRTHIINKGELCHNALSITDYNLLKEVKGG